MAVWCRTCHAPAKRTGSGIPGEGIHENGSDDHPVLLTDEDPVLRAQADAIEKDFPAFKVSVRFGWFRADRADLPQGVVAGHYTEDDAETMRATLARVTGRGVS